MRSVGSNVLNGGEYGIEASVITTVVLAFGVLIIIGLNLIYEYSCDNIRMNK